MTQGTSDTAALDRLVQTAVDLACRVRDEDPADVHYDLDHKTDPELIALVTVLAAMVPVDRPVSELLAWTTDPARYTADMFRIHRLPPPARKAPKVCPGCDSPVRAGTTYCDDGPCRVDARRATWRDKKRRAQLADHGRREAG